MKILYSDNFVHLTVGTTLFTHKRIPIEKKKNQKRRSFLILKKNCLKHI